MCLLSKLSCRQILEFLGHWSERVAVCACICCAETSLTAGRSALAAPLAVRGGIEWCLIEHRGPRPRHSSHAAAARRPLARHRSDSTWAGRAVSVDPYVPAVDNSVALNYMTE